MFANTFQSGFLTLFYSIGSNPLNIWDKTVKNGHIRRIVDEEVKSLVLEVAGTNVATTYITCPIKPRASLGVRLPFLVMVVKNLKKYFTFEIQILDDKNIRRRFRVSNFQSTTKVRPFCTTMPIGLSSGWNQIQFNLADFTKRAYGTTYVETVRVQIHANIRLRRIYFSSRLYSEEELPNEYKMFLPGSMAKRSTAAPSKTKQETLDEIKKQPNIQEIEVDQQGEEPEPLAAPPTPVEEVEEPVQPSPVEASEAAPSTEVTAADASEMPEGEKVEELLTEEAVDTPAEGTDIPPAEGGEVTAEAPAEDGEVTEPSPAVTQEEDVETAPTDAPPAEDVQSSPEAEAEAPPTE